MITYPVRFTASAPPTYSRAQLALRLVLFIVIGAVGASFGMLLGALYLLLPAFAAIILSSEPPERYIGRDAPRLTKFLHWIMAVFAYFALVTDRFPTTESGTDVELEVQLGG